MLAVGTFGKQMEKLNELVYSQRRLFAYFQIREVVVPNLPRRLALGEEEKVCLDARARRAEDAAGKADDAIEVAILDELALRLYECRLVRAEEYAFAEHHAATPARLEGFKDVLQEKYLRRARLVVEPHERGGI